MKLYIDTSNSEKIVVGINGENYTEDSRKEKSQKLLAVIDREVGKQAGVIKDLSEIEVVLGPGSYTGLKVGVSVANALSWTLQIPINGKNRLVEPSY